ncbi:hypothetical protein RYH80_18325 [Halobaculum sp. MBLA0147]|uniref:hypothetical protein n=1 Tax=Halobaculum sp. MBLA0147 TaxID=3079934 RepID=UPI0035243EB9
MALDGFRLPRASEHATQVDDRSASVPIDIPPRQYSHAVRQRLPDHETYVEPFFEFGTLAFAKEPARNTVVNDIQGDIPQLFRAIRANRDGVIAALTEFSKLSYRRLWSAYQQRRRPADQTDRAAAFTYLVSPALWTADTITKKMADRAVTDLTRQIHSDSIIVESCSTTALFNRYAGSESLFFLVPPFHGPSFGHPLPDEYDTGFWDNVCFWFNGDEADPSLAMLTPFENDALDFHHQEHLNEHGLILTTNFREQQTSSQQSLSSHA